MSTLQETALGKAWREPHTNTHPNSQRAEKQGTFRAIRRRWQPLRRKKTVVNMLQRTGTTEPERRAVVLMKR